jgi:hypothetical protein
LWDEYRSLIGDGTSGQETRSWSRIDRRKFSQVCVDG